MLLRLLEGEAGDVSNCYMSARKKTVCAALHAAGLLMQVNR
jgi:hypothetical protein